MKRPKIYEPYYDMESGTYHTPAGVRCERVTDILQGELKTYDGYPASASTRGHDVHSACQFYDDNDLRESSLTEEVAAYLECYKRAKAEYGINVLQNEVRRYHPVYLYAGTCDKPSIIGKETGIIDLKSGLKEKWHKWQTAAYWGLLKDEIPNLTALWTLYVKPGEYGGKGYDLVRYEKTPQRLFGEFLALFSAYTIKKNEGYIKEKRRV